ncbi:hypothetical protein, partial [Burkholderia multivorans]|uniref:hypothetical protein n=1 Tax=Burkholderia multivorans TaxID=87883 RepID=UPI00286FF02B
SQAVAGRSFSARCVSSSLKPSRPLTRTHIDICRTADLFRLLADDKNARAESFGIRRDPPHSARATELFFLRVTVANIHKWV